MTGNETLQKCCSSAEHLTAEKGQRSPLLGLLLGDTMANIFNSTMYSAALSQVRDHEKEYEERKKRKRKMNEHGPVPSTQEPVYMATSKWKATEPSPFRWLIVRCAAHARLYLTQINRTQEGRELQLSLTGNHTTASQQHAVGDTISLFGANVSGLRSQAERLGQEASQTAPSFIGLPIQLAVKSKTPEMRCSPKGTIH